MVICYYCNKVGHTSRECEVEKRESQEMCKTIGLYFEKYISQNYKCSCGGKLNHLNDNTPSCDIVCNVCNRKFEVKSKCLSVSKLPSDIYIKHGNYEYFQNRLNRDNLNMFLIIYGVDRRSKIINVKKIYCLPNSVLKSREVTIIKKVKRQQTMRCNLEFRNIPSNYMLPIRREKTYISRSKIVK